MVNISISADDQEDILDGERLIRVLQELIDAVNELDSRLSVLEGN